MFRPITAELPPSVQEQARLQVAQFIEIWKSQRDDWRSFTAKHFIAQGIAKTTIYRIMKRYEQEGSVVRATGSGRRATKMTREKMAQLRRSVDHKTGISQRSLAVRFGCTQGYISRTIKRLKIHCLKRTKVPRYMMRQNAKQRKDAEKCIISTKI